MLVDWHMLAYQCCKHAVRCVCATLGGTDVHCPPCTAPGKGSLQELDRHLGRAKGVGGMLQRKVREGRLHGQTGQGGGGARILNPSVAWPEQRRVA